MSGGVGAASQQVKDLEADRRTTEPYKFEIKLKNAITNIENQQKKVIEFISYWFFGFLSVGVGTLVYVKRYQWIGIASIMAGFTEMAFWTSPLFRSRGPQYAFDNLLDLKLIFSLLSWIFLIIIWIIDFKKKSQN